MGNYAGVDWAADKHDVRVTDEAGEELLEATFAHDERGLRALCRALLRLKVELVAIERADGLLVERLLDAGLRVLPMHPKQVAATRARFRAAGGKSDRFDAFVLCELARTDSHRFRVLEPDSDETKALRALTRAREDLVHARVALCSQLRAELEQFWPGPIGLFTKLDSPISLAFLERYPSPADVRGLGEQRLGAFLARQRYSGGQKPAELLAEMGDCRARYPTRETLAADAGQAAVAVESGKRKTASFRWGCNKRLRGAFCTLADSTRHWHLWAQDRYAAARARGHEHPRALRTLGRAWCRIVWRCWQDRTPYNPAKHRAQQQHCTVTVPTPSGTVPDLAATQRMLGAAVTEPTARRAEREALDGRPTSAITLGG
jgi:transposase